MLLSTAELQANGVVPDVTDIATIKATRLASACAGVSSATFALLLLLCPRQPLWLHVLAKKKIDPPNGRLLLSCFSLFREKSFCHVALRVSCMIRMQLCKLHTAAFAALAAPQQLLLEQVWESQQT